MRLDKFLANAGTGSRKDVKKLIRSGKVTVSGKVERDPARGINEEDIEVRVQGRPVEYHRNRYFMLNKPPGYVSATTDPRDQTVLDLLSEADRRNVFPIGRLDKDTTGLLLLSDDGELAHRLLSPGRHVPKVYEVLLENPVSNEDIKAFRDGLVVDEGFTAQSALLVRDEQNPCLSFVTITEGKFHQIKRMFAALGNRVLKLKRIRMGGLELDTSLAEGEYRKLSKEELMRLKI